MFKEVIFMKKILALLLIVCALTILCACNSGEQVYQTYNTGIEKFNQLDSFDMSVDVNMNMQLKGTKLDIPITMSMQSSNLSSDPEYLVNSSITILGAQTTSQVYYKNGYVYLAAAKNKYKQAMSLDDMKKNYATASIDIFNKDLLKQARLTKTKDGSTITVLLNGNTLKDKLNSMFFNMDTLFENFGGVEKFSFGNLSATLNYNNDGYLTSEVINYDMNCTDSSTPLNAKVKCTFNINNPGQPVAITPPADLNTYISIS